jgi:hypothetical protein
MPKEHLAGRRAVFGCNAKNLATIKQAFANVQARAHLGRRKWLLHPAFGDPPFETRAIGKAPSHNAGGAKQGRNQAGSQAGHGISLKRLTIVERTVPHCAQKASSHNACIESLLSSQDRLC